MPSSAVRCMASSPSVRAPGGVRRSRDVSLGPRAQVRARDRYRSRSRRSTHFAILRTRYRNEGGERAGHLHTRNRGPMLTAASAAGTVAALEVPVAVDCRRRVGCAGLCDASGAPVEASRLCGVSRGGRGGPPAGLHGGRGDGSPRGRRRPPLRRRRRYGACVVLPVACQSPSFIPSDDSASASASTAARTA